MPIENLGIFAQKGFKRSKEIRQKMSESKEGGKNFFWRGGINREPPSRKRIYLPSHPFANKQGYVKKSRIEMEKKIGRYLKPKEIVHHIDENPLNDNIDNLVLFPNRGEHQRFHFCPN